jgi:hypothetical protein
MSAYKVGYLAATNGEPKSNNPYDYRVNEKDYHEWSRGYNRAMQDLEQEAKLLRDEDAE